MLLSNNNYFSFYSEITIPKNIPSPPVENGSMTLDVPTLDDNESAIKTTSDHSTSPPCDAEPKHEVEPEVEPEPEQEPEPELEPEQEPEPELEPEPEIDFSQYSKETKILEYPPKVSCFYSN